MVLGGRVGLLEFLFYEVYVYLRVVDAIPVMALFIIVLLNLWVLRIDLMFILILLVYFLLWFLLFLTYFEIYHLFF